MQPSGLSGALIRWMPRVLLGAATIVLCRVSPAIPLLMAVNLAARILSLSLAHWNVAKILTLMAGRGLLLFGLGYFLFYLHSVFGLATLVFLVVCCTVSLDMLITELHEALVRTPLLFSLRHRTSDDQSKASHNSIDAGTSHEPEQAGHGHAPSASDVVEMRVISTKGVSALCAASPIVTWAVSAALGPEGGAWFLLLVYLVFVWATSLPRALSPSGARTITMMGALPALFYAATHHRPLLQLIPYHGSTLLLLLALPPLMLALMQRSYNQTLWWTARSKTIRNKGATTLLHFSIALIIPCIEYRVIFTAFHVYFVIPPVIAHILVSTALLSLHIGWFIPLLTRPCFAFSALALVPLLGVPYWLAPLLLIASQALASFVFTRSWQSWIVFITALSPPLLWFLITLPLPPSPIPLPYPVLAATLCTLLLPGVASSPRALAAVWLSHTAILAFTEALLSLNTHSYPLPYVLATSFLGTLAALRAHSDGLFSMFVRSLLLTGYASKAILITAAHLAPMTWITSLSLCTAIFVASQSPSRPIVQWSSSLVGVVGAVPTLRALSRIIFPAPPTYIIFEPVVYVFLSLCALSWQNGQRVSLTFALAALWTHTWGATATHLADTLLNTIHTALPTAFIALSIAWLCFAPVTLRIRSWIAPVPYIAWFDTFLLSSSPPYSVATLTTRGILAVSLGHMVSAASVVVAFVWGTMLASAMLVLTGALPAGFIVFSAIAALPATVLAGPGASIIVRACITFAHSFTYLCISFAPESTRDSQSYQFYIPDKIEVVRGPFAILAVSTSLLCAYFLGATYEVYVLLIGVITSPFLSSPAHHKLLPLLSISLAVISVVTAGWWELVPIMLLALPQIGIYLQKGIVFLPGIAAALAFATVPSTYCNIAVTVAAWAERAWRPRIDRQAHRD